MDARNVCWPTLVPLVPCIPLFAFLPPDRTLDLRFRLASFPLAPLVPFVLSVLVPRVSCASRARGSRASVSLEIFDLFVLLPLVLLVPPVSLDTLAHLVLFVL